MKESQSFCLQAIMPTIKLPDMSFSDIKLVNFIHGIVEPGTSKCREF